MEVGDYINGKSIYEEFSDLEGNLVDSLYNLDAVPEIMSAKDFINNFSKESEDQATSSSNNQNSKSASSLSSNRSQPKNIEPVIEL